MSEFFLVWLIGIEQGPAFFFFLCVMAVGLSGTAYQWIASGIAAAILVLLGVFGMTAIVLAPSNKTAKELLEIIRTPPAVQAPAKSSTNPPGKPPALL